MINIPQITSIKTFNSDQTPEITNISYDLWTLQITLQFSKGEPPVYIKFKDIEGFRVIDEGNLLEFWNPKIKTDNWLFKVNNGGWLDLEKSRKGFVSGVSPSDNLKEYLVAGCNDCVSVLTLMEPELSTYY